MQRSFYKGVLSSDLLACGQYIPGTITLNKLEAGRWYNRLVPSAKNKKGAGKHVRHGHAVIIEIILDDELIGSPDLFQTKGVAEHQKPNSWTSAAKQKAQVNEPVSYRILDSSEMEAILAYA